jgi:hypothetical protein
MDAKIRRAICDVLADQASRVPWEAFTPQDWTAFEAAARAERVAPMVCWKLEQASRAEIPPGPAYDQIAAAVTQFRNDFYQNCAHNLALYSELSRVLRQLQDNHAPVVLLKGIGLAATVYPDIALRPMGDIDILVHRPDLEAAVQALAPLGYKKLILITPWYEQIAGYHCHLAHETDPDRVVEVHWNLIGNPRDQLSPPVEWFWSQAVPWDSYTERGAFRPQPEVRDVFVQYQPRLLSPEACLLYLVAHLKIQHRTDGELLFWQYDLHQIVSVFQDSLDWGLVIRTAVSFHWLDILAEALLEIKAKFGSALPDEANAIVNAVESGGRPARRPASRIQKQLGRTQNLPLWARMLVLFAYLIPGRDYMLRHYQPRSAWLWPAYYFYRWADIFVEGLRTFVNLALKGTHR